MLNSRGGIPNEESKAQMIELHDQWLSDWDAAPGGCDGKVGNYKAPVG